MINKNQEKIFELSQELYRKSPRKIRDRLSALTKQATQTFSSNEIYNKFVKNNYDSNTRKYYYRTFVELSHKTHIEGELVPDNELDLDKYGNPRLKEDQVIVFRSSVIGDKKN